MDAEYAPAAKEFARAALRSNMTDIFPTNKYGTPSVGRAGFVRMILGKGALPVSSPLVHGIVTASGSAGAKLASELASHPELAPVFGQAAQSYLDNGGPGSMPDNSPPKEPNTIDRLIQAARSHAGILAPANTSAEGSYVPNVPATPSASSAEPIKNRTPDQEAYIKGLDQFLRNNLEGARINWQKAIKLKKGNLEARRGLERLAQKKGLDIDAYKPK